MKIFREIRKNAPESGFSMVEVIISSLIFAIAAAGIFSAITSLNKPAQESAQDTTAAYIAKDILDGFRQSVAASTWGSTANPLWKTGWQNMTSVTIGGITYYPKYKVEQDSADTKVRKVLLNITW